MGRPATLGALRAAGYQVRPVKDELRANLIAKIKAEEPLFPGIIGYDRTVIPALVNALLAKHDFILLGLRGQAKSRILRSLTAFLDEWIPIVAGCEINDNPFAPICKRCKRVIAEQGDDTPIAWIGREDRYREKLATPDVAIADLIGDIDPVKAATERRTYADEEVIHYGIIPRTNRGIFAINELPDLQPRIQVGLLNILEEGDIQVRGFPLRIPLDILITFTANPEDYTNRGNIITPLKDRIASQIITHYPETIEEGIAITEQEAWTLRDGGQGYEIPRLFREAVEEIAFTARKSEFVYQNSGVSARLPIAALEALASNLERRALATKEKHVYPRICDLYAAIPAITGKIELVYEGEREGHASVARRIIGGAVKTLFRRHFPEPYKPGRGRSAQADPDSPYQQIFDWFSKGGKIEVDDRQPLNEYYDTLATVDGLKTAAEKYLKPQGKSELATAMELVLEGLHQHSLIAKDSVDAKTAYFDMVKVMFDQLRDTFER